MNLSVPLVIAIPILLSSSSNPLPLSDSDLLTDLPRFLFQTRFLELGVLSLKNSYLIFTRGMELLFLRQNKSLKIGFDH